MRKPDKDMPQDVAAKERKEESLHNLFLSLPDPTSIMTPEGVRIDTNYATERLFRRSREEIIGASVEELYAREDAANIQRALERSKHDGFETCEVTCLREDGTHFPAILSFAPVRDGEDNVINVLISATDITDLKQKEKELDDAKAHLEGVITSIADALCVVDDEGKWFMVNAAMVRLSGYSEGELLGRKTLDQPFWQLPEAKEVTRDMWGRVEAGEIASGVEMPWVRKDGTRVIVSCSEQALKDDKGNVIGRVFTGRDMTELKKATSEVAQALGALSEGDLTEKVDVSSFTGDLREMGENINRSLDNLSILIQKVKEEMEVVSQTAQSLGASTEEMNASTSQISSTTSQMAQGAEDQARQIQEMRKAISNLKESGQRNASEAESVAQKSSRVAEVARVGSGAANDAIARTTNILDVTSQSAAAVRGLGELTEEIGLMVEVITSIADQTNLLSLNAAIEAARAGEQGRAFAVVAEEVKKLAGESRGSAGKIVNMVKRIESERVKTIASMDLNLKEVTEGREVITRALNALEEIAQMVRETADMSQNISTLSKNQEEATQRITQVVDEISTIASDNAAAAEEISASTEEQTASMQSLTGAAQELSGMAENLHVEVDKFRVNGRGSKTG
jgi:methyl-accepting chemotaxis protein